MSAKPDKDWKWQVVDAICDFMISVDPDRQESCELMTESDGQTNLTWDFVKQLFPASKFKPGAKLTALELGRLFGGFSALWRTIATSQAILDSLQKDHDRWAAVRDQIEEMLKGMGTTPKGDVETSLAHFMVDMNNPESVRRMHANRKRFRPFSKSPFVKK